MKTLFFGSVFSDKCLHDYRATNQAAHNWSKGFLGSLKKNNHEIHCLCFRNEQLWPKGNFYVKSKKKDFDKSFNVHPVSYLNLPVLRTFSLIFSYIIRFIIVQKKYNFNYLITYNLYRWHYIPVNYFRKDKSKLISIILDEDNPLKDNWKKFNFKTQKSDALVFLSYWGYKNYSGNIPKTHLDSGAPTWCGDVNFYKNNIPNIVYAGKYEERYGGLSELSEILNGIKFKSKIYLCGKADIKLINKYFNNNENIKYLGFLTDEELHNLFIKADIFINYRPLDIDDNNMIFPSKINHYLSYGTPVLSTKNLGLSPDYDEFLFYPDNEFISSYIKKLEQINSLSLQDKKEYSRKLETWFVRNKTWDSMVLKLDNWFKEIF